MEGNVEGSYQPRKRKSNFDVAPEELAAPNFVTTFLNQNSANTEIDALKEVERLRSQFGATYGDENVVFGIATDPQFVKRLEKALEKNFEYILRKDSMTTDQFRSGFESQTTATPKVHFSNPLRPNAATGLGAVSQQQQIMQQVQESLSVYVNNLPLDITEEELDILFGSSNAVSQQSSGIKMIRKIKLYTDSAGKKKGDALISFTKPDYAQTACIKYNNLDIGDGFVISVTRADFQQQAPASGSGSDKMYDKQRQEESGSGVTGSEQKLTAFTSGGSYLHSVVNSNTNQTVAASNNVSSVVSGVSLNDNKHNNSGGSVAVDNVLYSVLPEECGIDSFPVTIIRNVFDSSKEDQDGDFFDELEADMLIECCKFGKVRSIQCLVPCATLPEGSIAVTFDSLTAAQDCAAALRGRCFDGQLLMTDVVHAKCSIQRPTPQATYITSSTLSSHIPPPPPPPAFPKPKHISLEVTPAPLLATSVVDNSQLALAVTIETESLSTMPPLVSYESKGEDILVSAPDVTKYTDKNIAEIGEDVDDFLNSLL